jgi:hypothetical protein
VNAPAEGDFAVVATGGWVARGIRWVTRSKVNHAILSIGLGWIVEGDPKGAQLSHASKYPHAIWANWPLDALQQHQIGQWGRMHVGTRYSWVDDAEIGAVDMADRVKPVGHWLGRAVGWLFRKRLRSTRTLMCSQLVDAAYQAAGVQLFTDGRPAGAVSPGDLYILIEKRGATHGAG